MLRSLLAVRHPTGRQFFCTYLTIGFLLASVLRPGVTFAADWSIPLAGNSFRTEPSPGAGGVRRGGGFRRNGAISWSDTEVVYSVFFHLDRPASIDLDLNARSPESQSIIETRIGAEKFATAIDSNELARHQVGRVNVSSAGYVRVDLQRTSGDEKNDVEIRDLIVSSDTQGLVVDYVRTNEANMFYWGRRGPSVHLRYEVPRQINLRFAYSEVTVPAGQDPIGSFFMANGFGEGYFGIQVNGPEERRVLFSVWSPFRTDNPRDIPEDQRIVALAKGPEVRVGEFGNEGSGGQSFLVYPWKAGTTYRFLTEVNPGGDGSTTYTSWFGEKSSNEWRLIASFRRPKTDTHLRRFHSFLESFSPSFGHIGRKALYGNVWVRDVNGDWHECNRAQFSVDATGGGRHRLDFAGGAEGQSFFLRNCGFFNDSGRPGETIVRESTVQQRPAIDFDALPRGT